MTYFVIRPRCMLNHHPRIPPSTCVWCACACSPCCAQQYLCKHNISLPALLVNMKCDNSFFLHHDHLFPPHRFMLPLITFIRQASNGFLCPAFSQSNRTGQYKLPPTCVRGEKKRKETRSVQMIYNLGHIETLLFFLFLLISSSGRYFFFPFCC